MAASRSAKNRIIDAAWALFREKGYAATTVDDIIEKSNTSKGSFYHYFAAKDALLATLCIILDQEYSRFEETIGEDENRYQLLLRMNYEIHSFMRDSMDKDLLAHQYSSQLISVADRNLLDNNRTYYKVLRRLIQEGQERGEIIDDVTVEDIALYYSMCERALIYDWCLKDGSYDLGERSRQWMAMMMEHYQKR